MQSRKNPYRIINSAIKRRLAEGFRIKDQTYGLQGSDLYGNTLSAYQAYDCLCPMGCVLLGKKPAKGWSYEAEAARVLGKPKRWVEEFVAAFDDDFSDLEGKKIQYRDAVRFATKLRGKHILNALPE